MNVMLRAFFTKWQAPLLFGFATLAFTFTCFHVLGLLPTVMQDEYLYNMAARHLPMSSAQIPDYLFYWVYSTTSLCGPAFYTCAKALNLVFLAGTSAFVFLIARSRLSASMSALVAIVTFAGPVSMYASFFMPDVMFYCFVTGFIWFLLRLDARTKYPVWGAAGVIFGLASLAKPHALFLTPAVVAFILYISFSSGQRIVSWSAARVSIFGLSTLVTKFALGFIFAGVSGLTLFGSAYSDSLKNFVSNTSMNLQLDAPGLKTNGVLRMTSPEVANYSEAADQNAGGVLGWLIQQVAGHVGGIAIIAGLGVMIICSMAGIAIKNRHAATWEDRATVFSLSALLTTSVIGVAFTVLLTVNGHQHTDRLLFRYFEYLIPVAWVLAIIFSRTSRKIAGSARWIAGGLFVAVLCAAAAQIPQFFTVNFFDTTFLSGLVANPLLLWLVVAATILASVLWSAGRNKLFPPILVLLFVLNSATAAQASFNQVSSRLNADYYDSSAAFVKDYLDESQLSRLTVVGVNDLALQRTLFAIDSPNVDSRILRPNGLFDPQYLAEDKDWVLLLGDVAEATKPTYQIAGNGYVLARYSKVPEFNFSQEVGSGLISGATGLGRPESWGAWTIGNETSIHFARPASANAILSLTLSASQANAGQVATASLCGSAIEFQVPTEPTTAKLTFANPEPCSELTITNPLPKSIGEPGEGLDNRLVGYRLYLVQLNN